MIDLLAGQVAPEPDRVVPRQPAAMSHQIARSEMRSRVFVMHPKIRQVFPDRLVPIEFSLPNQRGERGHRELFRDRPDRHLRLRCHRHLFLDIAQAIALQEHDVVTHYDRNGETGNLKRFQFLLDDLINPSERLSGRRFFRLKLNADNGSQADKNSYFHGLCDVGQVFTGWPTFLQKAAKRGPAL